MRVPFPTPEGPHTSSADGRAPSPVPDIVVMMISSLSPPLSGGLFHPLVSRSPISIRPAVIREGWREIPSENQEAAALGEILSLEGGELVYALVKDRAAKSGWKVTIQSERVQVFVQCL